MEAKEIKKIDPHDVNIMKYIIKELKQAHNSIKAYAVEQKCCLTETESTLLHYILDSYIYNMEKRIEHPDIVWENMAHKLKWDFIREMDLRPLSIEERHKWNRSMIK